MRQFWKSSAIRKWVESWITQMAAGIILLVSVVTDLVHVEHGLITVALWHILRAVPNVLQAMERILVRWKDAPGASESRVENQNAEA